ncbi:MAG: hypothetical protein H7A55_08265 [Verrucomicrobiaceae bacterium]|nr:hypothetical protein [Verrucomicrobiaceae bacterium]
METTTGFESWLDGIELENHAEVYSLHRSVNECTSYGPFTTGPVGGSSIGWIVNAFHCEQPLLLASLKAKQAFLACLIDRYCEGDVDMESWYGAKLAMAKPD